jgi:methyl-accepting chemotaxis protein
LRQGRHELVSEIATTSSEQTKGIEQVNLAVNPMDKVVQASAARAEEGASVAQELISQSSILEHNVFELSNLVGGKQGHSNKREWHRNRASNAPVEKKSHALVA